MKKYVLLFLLSCISFAKAADSSNVDFYLGFQFGAGMAVGEQKSSINNMDVNFSNSVHIALPEAGIILMDDFVVKLRLFFNFYHLNIDDSYVEKQNPGYLITNEESIEYWFNYSMISLGLMYRLSIGDFSIWPYVDIGYILGSRANINYPMLKKVNYHTLRHVTYKDDVDYSAFKIIPGLRLSYPFFKLALGNVGVMLDFYYDSFNPDIVFETTIKEDDNVIDKFQSTHSPELSCFGITFGLILEF